MSYVDTHAHLDYDYELSTRELIDEAKSQGVDKIITIAAEPKSIEATQKIAEAHPEVWFTTGIHPHEAKDFTPEIKSQMESAGKHPRCVAIGEIGLDYHYMHSDRETQMKVFEEQIELAKDLKQKIVIHTRNAEDDSWDILQRHFQVGQSETPGVIHSFTGTIDFAKKVLTQNWMIAFNGITTFKKAEELREVVRNVPLSHTLLETDCPFLTPHPHRGKQNKPAYIPLIAQTIADCHNTTIDEVAKITTHNAINLFGI